MAAAPARTARRHDLRGLQVAVLPAGHGLHGGLARVLVLCVPHAAGWFAAPDVYGAFYGPPLRLATTARRLDASPAWHAWMGAVASLDVLQGIGIEAMHAHDVVLGRRAAEALDLPPTGSAIVSIVGAEPASSGRSPRSASRVRRGPTAAACRSTSTTTGRTWPPRPRPCGSAAPEAAGTAEPAQPITVPLVTAVSRRRENAPRSMARPVRRPDHLHRLGVVVAPRRPRR